MTINNSLSLDSAHAMLREVRLNRLSNWITLVAAVELLVLLGMGLNRWLSSYQGLRDSSYILHQNRAQ